MGDTLEEGMPHAPIFVKANNERNTGTNGKNVLLHSLRRNVVDASAPFVLNGDNTQSLNPPASQRMLCAHCTGWFTRIGYKISHQLYFRVKTLTITNLHRYLLKDV